MRGLQMTWENAFALILGAAIAYYLVKLTSRRKQ